MPSPNVKFNVQTKRFRKNLDRFGEALEDITDNVAELALEKARELEEPHIDTQNLYNSLRLEKRDGTKLSSINVVMGGLATTKNSKGVDYAAYHEVGTSVSSPAHILTQTAEWVRQEGLDEAVQLSLSKVNIRP